MPRAKQPERAVKFLLNHHCYLPGAEGVMGQTIEVRRDIAERLSSQGGGRIVEQPSDPATEPESAAEVESDPEPEREANAP